MKTTRASYFRLEQRTVVNLIMFIDYERIRCLLASFGFEFLFFQDFQGFLNDLQDWELLLKDKDKKIKQQPAYSSNPVRSFVSWKDSEVLKFDLFL